MTDRFQVKLQIRPQRAYAGSKEACESFKDAALVKVATITTYDGKRFEVGEVVGAEIERIR